MNTMRQIPVCFIRCHGGAALIGSLLFLLILTLTGATAMMLSTLEERMSGNLRDRNLAFQAAESALRQGEEDLEQSLDNHVPGAFNCIGGPDSTVCPVATDVSASGNAWTIDGTVVFSYSKTLPHVAKQPIYRIEVLPYSMDSGASEAGIPNDDKTLCHYRITARGTGGMSSTVVVVQSTYAHIPVKLADNSNRGVCHG